MEYNQIKMQLDRLRKQLHTRSGIQIGSSQVPKDHRTAKQWTRAAFQTRHLSEEIDHVGRAIEMDDTYLDAYIIRGQTYLKAASLSHDKKEKQADVTNYVQRAAADFDRALILNPQSLGLTGTRRRLDLATRITGRRGQL